MRRRAQPYARSDTDRIMNDLFRSLGAGVVAYGMTLGANEKTANGFTTSVLYRSRNVKISVGKYGRDLYIGLFNEVPEVVVHMSSDTIDQEKIPRIVDEIVSIVIRKSEALSESNGSMSDSEGKVVTNPEISVQNREKNKATQSNANHWLDSLKSSMDKEFGNKVSDFNEFEVSMQKFSVNFTLHNLKIYIVLQFDGVWVLDSTCDVGHVCLKTSTLDENLVESVISLLNLYLAESLNSVSSFDSVVVRLLSIILEHSETLDPKVREIIKDLSDFLKSKSR